MEIRYKGLSRQAFAQLIDFIESADNKIVHPPGRLFEGGVQSVEFARMAEANQRAENLEGQSTLVSDVVLETRDTVLFDQGISGHKVSLKQLSKLFRALASLESFIDN